jgi:hypothetical protein
LDKSSLDILSRLQASYYALFENMAKSHSVEISKYEAKISTIQKWYEEKRKEFDGDIEKANQKFQSMENQLSDYKIKSELTQEQKNALKFFEDNYLQSQSLGQLIHEAHVKTLTEGNEQEKMILTAPEKIIESGATEVRYCHFHIFTILNLANA